jgi:hypothetical protein
MREKKSRLFAVATIIIILVLALFIVFSGRIFGWLSARYLSTESSQISLPDTSSSTATYFDTSILDDKQFQALKDYSSGFDFDIVGQKTMAPAQNILDDEGNIIGQSVIPKTYSGNNRPF